MGEYLWQLPLHQPYRKQLETVIADGFRTIEELCTGDVAETDFCVENG